MKFGEAVRIKRKARGLTLRQVADALECSVVNVGNIELCRQLCSSDMGRRLAAYLGEPGLYELLEEEVLERWRGTFSAGKTLSGVAK